MTDLRAIVLAAGKGTRMKSDLPKVVHPVAGRPMIQYVLDVISAVGSLKTYIVLGHKVDIVKAYLPSGVSIVIQKALLGTGDAVKSAAQFFKGYRGDILVCCGDTPLLTKKTVKDTIATHRRTKAACTVLTAVVESPHGYGRIIRDQEGRVTAIREDKDAQDGERGIKEINVGVYCFSGRSLWEALSRLKPNPLKKEYYLTDVIAILAKSGKTVKTVRTDQPEEGAGVNSRMDLAAASQKIRQRILKHWMEEGVTITDPNTTFIHQDVKIGKDTIIEPFSIIEGNVRVGKSCKIGPFARLRSGSRIGNHVEIGNFTELNRTQFGDYSLMKHFSYLGDAMVGSNVNIGAGTVTANFDGQNKHVTKIADKAFIGSDSILIAPVKIGRRAVVAAGSVVTKGKNVPPDGRAMGVPAVITSGRKRS